MRGQCLRNSGDALGAAVRDDELHVFLGDARAQAAVDMRRQRRWLVRQLDEDRTFEDVCARAMREGAPVDVLVASGRSHRGRVLAAHSGLVAVAVADGGTVYITGAAVVGVRVRPDATAADHPPETVPGHAPTTAPSAAVGATFSDVARELADGQALVGVGTVDGRLHRGRINGVGRDVLRLDDGMHLRLDMVTEVIAVT
ncbi:MAG TPA: hypothetical protein VK923_17420 [Euzebyales bacterium]|nr:hypothetical protein [Euzebyales bacterium]